MKKAARRGGPLEASYQCISDVVGVYIGAFSRACKWLAQWAYFSIVVTIITSLALSSYI